MQGGWGMAQQGGRESHARVVMGVTEMSQGSGDDLLDGSD